MKVQEYFVQATEAFSTGNKEKAKDIYWNLIDHLLEKTEGKNLSDDEIFSDFLKLMLRLLTEQRIEEVKLVRYLFADFDFESLDYWEIQYKLDEINGDISYYLSSFSRYYVLAKEKHVVFEFNEKEKIIENLHLCLTNGLGDAYTVIADYCEHLLKLEPNNVFALETLAQAYWEEERRFHEIEDVYYRILDIDPDNIEAIIGMSKMRFYLDEVSEATHLLTEYQKNHPNSYRISIHLAWIYQEKKWIEGAEIHSNNAFNEGEKTPEIWLEKSKMYYNFKFYDFALQSVNEALKITFEDDEAKLLKVEILKSLDNLTEAITLLDDIIQKNSNNNIILLYQKAELLEKMAKFDKALKVYDRLYSLEKNSNPLLKKVKILESNKNTPELIETFEKLSNISPKNMKYKDSLCDYYLQLNDTKNAIKMYQIMLEEDSMKDMEKSHVLSQIGKIYRSNNQGDKALEFYNKALDVLHTYEAILGIKAIEQDKLNERN